MPMMVVVVAIVMMMMMMTTTTTRVLVPHVPDRVPQLAEMANVVIVRSRYVIL